MGKLDRLFGRRPPIDSPPVSSIKGLQIVVRDRKTDAPIADASVTINTSVHEWETLITNELGIVYFTDIPYYLYNTHLIIEKKGYEKIDASIILPQEREISRDEYLTSLPPVFKSAPVLSIDKTHFLANGALARVQGITAFVTLQHYMENKTMSVGAIFDFGRLLHANLIRVLGEIGWTNFDPSDYSTYYDLLDEFFTYCKFQGFWVDYNCFAMAERYDSIEMAKLHVARTSSIAARHSNVLYSLGNEPFKNLPFDTSPHDFFTSIDPRCKLWNYGASPDPKLPYKPTGTFVSEHTPRDNEWFRKSKHAIETQDFVGVPDLLAEPMGAIGVIGSGTSSQRDNDPRHFLEYFACGSLFAGSVFHSEELKFSRIPTGKELECAFAARAGWDSIPVEFMQGHYSALHISDCPIEQTEKLMKGYFMILGNRAMGVMIQPEPGYVPQTKDGWRIVENKENCILTLER